MIIWHRQACYIEELVNIADETLPRDWLIYDLKGTRTTKNANSWDDNQDGMTYVIHNCRVDYEEALVNTSEGTGGNIAVKQGVYKAYIDKQISWCEISPGYPGNIIKVGDTIEWRTNKDLTYDLIKGKAIVKSIAVLYGDNHINHWEVTMQ